MPAKFNVRFQNTRDHCFNISFVLQERKKKGETDEQAFLADVNAYQVSSFIPFYHDYIIIIPQSHYFQSV